jgi:hypothetical protein
MLQIAKTVYDQLRRHGEASYPHECCGVLLGTKAESGKSVIQAVPVENSSTDNTRNHYRIDPTDLVRILREARIGDASRKGILRTLRLIEAGSRDSEGSEATLGHPFISVPGVIAGQVHVLPAERGDILKQSGIEGM